ncbi:MAG: hypothetical protein H8K04_11375 [Nitrospira sp.]
MKEQCRNSWSVVSGAVTLCVVLSACATASTSPVKQKRTHVADQTSRLHSLEKQIREKNKRIEELETQLAALKLIDQDAGKQRKPFELPSMTIPIK